MQLKILQETQSIFVICGAGGIASLLLDAERRMVQRIYRGVDEENV